VGASPTHLRLDVAGSSLLNCLESPPPSLGIEEYLSLDPDMGGMGVLTAYTFFSMGKSDFTSSSSSSLVILYYTAYRLFAIRK